MKTRKTVTNTLLLILLLFVASATPASAQSASVLLQEGLYAEEIEGDLDAAIKIYEKVIAQAEQTQQAAAMAMYRIGMCRLKKGDKTQAATQFQQIIDKFPAQKSLVAKTRQQLAKIQPAAVAAFRPVIHSSNDGKVYFYDFDKEKVFPRPEWLTRDSSPKKVLDWGRKNGIDFIIDEKGHIELADMIAVKVAYRLWDSAGHAEINDALDKGPHETTSLSTPDQGHETSAPITYVFETREGGSGILQILGKKDDNVKIRYKMLDKTALAMKGKVNVYEYLPMEVLHHIAGKYGSISSEAAAKGLYSNSHIYFITSDWILLSAGMGYHRNGTGRAITGKIHLSGTSNPNQTLYDVAGREMDTEIVPDKVRKNFYHIYWTPSEPLPPGQMFYYGWSTNDSKPLNPAPNSGHYSLRMQNMFGQRCIETFFLVVPEGSAIISKTEDFTAKDSLAGFDIYYWSKEVPPSTNNEIDLQLAPSPGAAHERILSRSESANHLKQIGVSLHMYADDQEKALPDTLDNLRAYVEDRELLEWVRLNVEYLGSGEKLSEVAEPQTSVLAYDRTLMAQGKGTNVLFLDGHVEFLAAGEIDTPGIVAEIVRTAVLTISTCAESDPRVPESLDSLKPLDSGSTVKELCKYLESDTATVRRSAIFILWRGGFDDAAAAEEQLIRLCDHEENLTKGMAMLALGECKLAAGYDILADKAVNGGDGYVRRCAAYALGLYGDKKALPVLEKALQDKDPLVKGNAQAAITMLTELKDAGQK